MIGGLISLIVFLCVLALIVWCVTQIIGVFPGDPTIKNIIVVVVRVVAIFCAAIALLQFFGFYDAGLPVIHHWRR
jgi:hypothetical protein